MATTKRPRGRPPLPADEVRRVQVPVRLTEDERARYEAAASAAGVTLADEARRAWERLARKVSRGSSRGS